MRKRHFLMAAIAAVAPASLLQAAAVPIGVTGQNQPVVVRVGATDVATGTTADYDNGPGGTLNTFYQVGQNAAAPATGLPVGIPFASQSNPSVTYQIPATGNDDFQLNRGPTASVASVTATLVTPAAYSSLSFATSSGNGTGNMTATLNFAGGSSDFVTFTSPDWFNNTPIA